MLRLGLGLGRPDAVTLTVLGSDPAREPDAVRARVGYVPDRPDAPPWMTVDELCRFVRAHFAAWNDAAVESLVDQLGVPRGVRLGALSKGQAMKAMLVLALGHDSDLLLLDEPFGGLDPLVREDVLRAVLGALRAERRTVLCATHELDVAARLADRVVLLADGRVRAHGSVASVLGVAEPSDVPRGLGEALRSAVQEVAPC